MTTNRPISADELDTMAAWLREISEYGAQDGPYLRHGVSDFLYEEAPRLIDEIKRLRTLVPTADVRP